MQLPWTKGTVRISLMPGHKDNPLHDELDVRGREVSTIRDKMVTFLIGAFTIVGLPYIHIGIVHLKLWVPEKRRFSKENCTCGCFDTVFKGTYQAPGPMTGYKHVYFNATWQTLRIWIVTVVFILVAYESVKRLIPLIRRGRCRRTMLLLFLVNIYPHYYSWWTFFNYYNDDFYTYFSHQIWFTVTEVLTTCIVLNLADTRNEIKMWKILCIISMSSIHILVAGMDQFIVNVVFRKGATFRKLRDIGLIIPDILHVAIPLWELFNHAKTNEFKMREMCCKKVLFICFVFITMGTLIVRQSSIE